MSRRIGLTTAQNAAAVTPSDSTEFTPHATQLYVGGTGHVSVEMADTGTAVVFNSVPAGTVLDVTVRRVNSTSTTATNIVRLW